MNLVAFPQFFKKINQLISPSRINHDLISDAAIDIVIKLQENDYEAYIVGGAIRDILLDHPPKDFDIATNAKPEDIRKIFKYSRIIGRRFKLVHVIYNRETIEVSTFRTAPTEKIHMKNGILKDNEYGSMSEDIKRRDFTINALYYDPINKKLIDTFDGKSDIKKKIVKLIGDPQKRFTEDPIRVLRALRFTAKLDMGIHHDTLKHIKPSMKLLETIPHSRLFDEILKFFLTGHAIKSLAIFREYNLTKKLLLKITDTKELLSASSHVSLSIHRRMPYLDPLNYIQVKLLKEYRKNNNPDLFDPLLRTIHAIAKGMKNTG